MMTADRKKQLMNQSYAIAHLVLMEASEKTVFPGVLSPEEIEFLRERLRAFGEVFKWEFR